MGFSCPILTRKSGDIQRVNQKKDNILNKEEEEGKEVETGFVWVACKCMYTQKHNETK